MAKKQNFRTDDENRTTPIDQPEFGELSAPPTYEQVTEWFHDPDAQGKIIDGRSWRLIGRPDVVCGELLELLSAHVVGGHLCTTLDFEDPGDEVTLRCELGGSAPELRLRRAYLIIEHDLSSPPHPFTLTNQSLVFVAANGQLIHVTEQGVTAKFGELIRAYNSDEHVGYTGFLGSSTYRSGPYNIKLV